MLEAYSKDVTVNGGANIPLNNLAIVKGKSAELQGSASIALNACGVYRVKVTANVTPSSAGVASVQLAKNGALVDYAISQATAESGSIYALGFETLVQVPRSNTNCPCTSPTVISVVNGLAADVSIDVVVDKIV